MSDQVAISHVSEEEFRELSKLLAPLAGETWIGYFTRAAEQGLMTSAELAQLTSMLDGLDAVIEKRL